MLDPEVELGATLYFAGGSGAARVAARRSGGEGRHGAGRVGVESVLPAPRPLSDMEAKSAGEEETQWPGLAAHADPLACQVRGQPWFRQQVRRRSLRAPRYLIADVTSVCLQQSHQRLRTTYPW